MIERNWHIVLLALVFVGAVLGIDAVHFWDKVGLEHPHGLIFQGLLFLGFYFVLSNTVFTPYIAIMHEREEQTVGKRLQVEATQRKADAILAQYQASIEEAKSKAIKERELSGIRAEEEAKNQIESTKKKAIASLIEAKSALEAEVASAKKNIAAESQTVAQEVVKKIVAQAAPAASSSRQHAQAQ